MPLIQIAQPDRLNGLLRQNSAFHLTIKLPRTFGGRVGWAEDPRTHSNCTVVSAGAKFSDLLQTDDAVLVDSPTTTMLESISTPLPVFVLLGVVDHAPAAVRDLKRRAVCFAEPNDLIDAVGDWLARGNFAADRRDDFFLRGYGIHLADGRRTNRAELKVERFLGASSLSDLEIKGVHNAIFAKTFFKKIEYRAANALDDLSPTDC